MSEEQITERYKGIAIWVERVAEQQFDGVFRWNGRIIRTDPAYAYAFTPQQALDEAKGVIDTLLNLRREGIYVADEEEKREGERLDDG